MPDFGMHLGLEQRLEQRLEQVLIMAVGEDDMVEPFRTSGEKKQVSQYEILKVISKVLEDGEFIDPDHFELELNRAVFSHPLQASLGNFGRDVGNLIRAYQSDDLIAKRIIALLSSQKADDKKDIPGKIASSWANAISSDYFVKEPEQRRVLSLVELLRAKDADISEGMDVIGRVAGLKDQRELVATTLEKIRAYSESDVRMIPFAQKVLAPIFRRFNEGQHLSEEEAKGIYRKIVEELYMLDRELRIPGYEKISDRVSKDGMKALLASALPVPHQVLLDALDAGEAEARLIELAKSQDFQQGRELQRNIYKGLSSLEDLHLGREILYHVVKNARDIKGLGRILGAINLVASERDFSYSFDLADESEILRNLKLQLVDKSIKRLKLNDATLEKYLDRVGNDERFERISRILTTLAGYSHYQNPEQMGLLREIAEVEIDGKYLEWKYGHDLAKEQLKVLEGKIDSWKENQKVVRIVGELEALDSHIASIKKVLPKVQDTYAEFYKTEIEKVDVNALEAKIAENEAKLRSGASGKEKGEIGYQTGLLREQLQFTHLLKNLQGLTTDNYGNVLGQADLLSKRKSKNPLSENVKWIRETLDQPVYRDARKITVYSTDDLETLLRMGESPVPHCQNWKFDSSYNGSLISFAADANKKLYHIANGDKNPFGMSLIRLVDWQNIPSLLIENIYSNEWSIDYGIALLGSLADKALEMYKETGKEVRIVALNFSGHQVHDTNVQVVEAMEAFGKQYRAAIHSGSMRLTPAKSKNRYEYWDCGVGKVESGSEIHLDNVHYISFGGSGDD